MLGKNIKLKLLTFYFISTHQKLQKYTSFNRFLPDLVSQMPPENDKPPTVDLLKTSLTINSIPDHLNNFKTQSNTLRSTAFNSDVTTIDTLPSTASSINLSVFQPLSLFRMK